MSRCTPSEISPTSEFICKQDIFTKTRLCNISKGTNAKTLIKVISEIPYKVLQTT